MMSATFNYRFGFWVCVVGIVLALIYMSALAATAISPSGFPPVYPYDVIIDVISLASAVGILILFCAVHSCSGTDRKLFSRIALAFAVLFAGMTIINRFTHLAVVRPAQAAGVTEGLDWFTPYGAHSIMTGLENLGWGFFLGLAFISLAPVFTRGKLERFLCGVLLINGVLCLVSVFTLITGITALTFIGAVAWGPGFTVFCLLLSVFFKHGIDPQGRFIRFPGSPTSL